MSLQGWSPTATPPGPPAPSRTYQTWSCASPRRTPNGWRPPAGRLLTPARNRELLMAQPVPQEPEPLDFGRVEPSMAPSQDYRKRDPVDRVDRIAKRAIDVVLAGLMLLMLSP